MASGFSRKDAAVVNLWVASRSLPAKAGSHPSQEKQSIYLDPGRPSDVRKENPLNQLTLAEKISLLGTTAPAIERLKIPAMKGWNQSLHGIVWIEPTVPGS